MQNWQCLIHKGTQVLSVWIKYQGLSFIKLISLVSCFPFKSDLSISTDKKTLSGYQTETLSGYQTETLSGYQTETLSGYQTEILSGYQTEILLNLEKRQSSSFLTKYIGFKGTVANSGIHILKVRL